MYEDQYTIVQDVVAPGGEYGEHSHLVDFQTQQLLSQLWTQYLASIRAELPPTDVGQVVRRVSYQLDSEAFAGDALQRGIRVERRSRRSCTFGVALWQAGDGRMVHSGEIITVFVEPGKGSVEIPGNFW